MSICRICQSNSLYIKYTRVNDFLFRAKGLWDYYECNRCKTIFLNDSSITLIDRYTKTYSFRKGVMRNKNTLKKYLKHFRDKIFQYIVIAVKNYPYENKYQKMAGYLFSIFPVLKNGAIQRIKNVEYIKNGKILDLGCGIGDYLDTMKTLGWKTYGLDFDKRVSDIASSKGHIIHLGQIDDLIKQEKGFDIITMNHLIEHIENPKDYIKKSLRLLNQNGKLIIHTPNASSIMHQIFDH